MICKPNCFTTRCNCIFFYTLIWLLRAFFIGVGLTLYQAGQYAVFYNCDGICIGSGVIQRPLPGSTKNVEPTNKDTWTSDTSTEATCIPWVREDMWWCCAFQVGELCVVTFIMMSWVHHGMMRLERDPYPLGGGPCQLVQLLHFMPSEGRVALDIRDWFDHQLQSAYRGTQCSQRSMLQTWIWPSAWQVGTPPVAQEMRQLRVNRAPSGWFAFILQCVRWVSRTLCTIMLIGIIRCFAKLYIRSTRRERQIISFRIRHMYYIGWKLAEMLYVVWQRKRRSQSACSLHATMRMLTFVEHAEQRAVS